MNTGIGYKSFLVTKSYDDESVKRMFLSELNDLFDLFNGELIIKLTYTMSYVNEMKYIMVHYGVYNTNYTNCSVGDVVEKDYFEVMYDDMDVEFDVGYEMEINIYKDNDIQNPIKTTFLKESDCWKRIK